MGLALGLITLGSGVGGAGSRDVLMGAGLALGMITLGQEWVGLDLELIKLRARCGVGLALGLIILHCGAEVSRVGLYLYCEICIHSILFASADCPSCPPALAARWQPTGSL